MIETTLPTDVGNERRGGGGEMGRQQRAQVAKKEVCSKTTKNKGSLPGFDEEEKVRQKNTACAMSYTR